MVLLKVRMSEMKEIYARAAESQGNGQFEPPDIILAATSIFYHLFSNVNRLLSPEGGS